MDDILKDVLIELNTLHLTKNKPPKLTPLLENKKVGPNQSDILKVKILYIVLKFSILFEYWKANNFFKLYIHINMLSSMNFLFKNSK